MNLLAELRRRFDAALAPLVADDAKRREFLEMIRPAQDAKFGDYQANFSMPLGKLLGKPPREIAERLAANVDVANLCEPPEVAGPGFINVRFRREWLAGRMQTLAGDERLGVEPAIDLRKYVVDYSAPNVAKPMHVGHIRSTVIGDSLCRMLRFAGHDVVSDNHLGDWGTQFGMIIYGYKHFVDRAAYQWNALHELARLYRLVRKLMDYRDAVESLPALQAELAQRQAQMKAAESQPASADKNEAKQQRKQIERARNRIEEASEAIAETERKIAAVEADASLKELAAAHPRINEAVLEETAKLHAGDEENIQLWKTFLPACRADIQRIYDRLGVTFDVEYGESFYHAMLPEVVADLSAKGLAAESDGAMCVFLDGFEAPMIIRKRDGAYLYATTDLATIRYRMETWRPDAILYVVDFRQAEHFGKLFAAARRWGYDEVELAHVSFGTVLGDDGKPFKTRSGDTVGLEGLLDEAVQRALAVVSANDDAKPNGAELTADRRQEIAETVGIAALKYADLSQNRTSDYTFSYEKMLAMNGNSATYMQFSYARVQGIFAKGEIDIAALRASETAISLDLPAERALAMHLLRLPEALDEALADYRPNLLTNYLFDLGKAFSTFYEQAPVLAAESEPLRASRLLLCDITARALRQGLYLLGIEVVEKM